jgi:uncharacterized protein YcfJ
MKNIKNFTVATVIGAGMMVSGCATAIAGATYNQMATVISAQPKYATTVQQVPNQSCGIVDVPIYGSQNTDTSGNTIIGAIIGGAIGNQIGTGKGNGAAGAVIGGLLGNQHGKNNNQQIIGYRQENRCTTTYTSERVERFIGTYVTVDYNGMQMSYTTNRNVNVGDQVNIRVSLNN